MLSKEIHFVPQCLFLFQELDWEVELAIVVGKLARDVPASRAMEHVLGYTVAHDVSARDWQLR